MALGAGRRHSIDCAKRRPRRAVAEGVAIRQFPGPRAWVATSGTDADAAYVVSHRECECPAGAWGDPVCKHRAALAAKLGCLSVEPEPDPPAPAAPAVAPRRMTFGLAPAELVLLKGQAMRRHVLHGEPLVDVETGELLAA